MARAALVVKNFSYFFVRHSVDYIHAALRRGHGECDLLLCDEIDDADYEEGATVYVIGENFRPPTRRPRSFYVFLNFSVVALMGNPLVSSANGLRMIWRKRKLLNNKIDRFDVLLDYLQPQTARLQRQYDLPVRWFPFATSLDGLPPFIPLEERKYDVCFVGGKNPRREKVLATVREAGWSMSPSSDVVFEDVAANSRVCLNLHSNRSNHLETPRILGSMATQCALVTEHCFALDEIAPPETVTAANITNLVPALSELLSRPDEIAAQIERANRWYRDTLLPRYDAYWDDLVKEIKDLRDEAKVLQAHD